MNGSSIGAHWKGCQTWQPCRILRDLAGEIWSLRIWHVIDNPQAVVPGRGWHARSAWCDLEKRPRRVIIRYRASLPKAPGQRARAGLTISPSAQPACLRIVVQCCSSCPRNAFIPGMHQLHTMRFMTPNTMIETARCWSIYPSMQKIWHFSDWRQSGFIMERSVPYQINHIIPLPVYSSTISNSGCGLCLFSKNVKTKDGPELFRTQEEIIL